MKSAFFSLAFSLSLICVSIAQAAPARETATCEKPMMYFDLGDVLVDTHDWDNLRYMPDAQKYIENLKHDGYKLGLIVNIPAEWGKSDAQRVKALKAFIAKTWKEKEPFAWDLFSKIFVPRTNAERKPAPVMFERALRKALPCPAIYQGEKADEIAAAAKVGLKTHGVGEGDEFKFLPEEQICRVAGLCAASRAKR